MDAYNTTVSSYVLIRPVTSDDLAELQTLADLLDTVNLPDDPAALQQIISESTQSFAATATPLDQQPNQQQWRQAAFTFVAVEITAVHGVIQRQRLLGTASIFALHGTAEDPHYYLRVVETTVHSKQLNTDRKRLVLKLGRDTDPWTELGGLIVHPDARGKGVGKLLVAVRLLFIAMHPERFAKRLIAELLPPRREDGGNAFWDAVGGALTGLPYYRADLLCRSDKEFIDAFFPHEEIVGDLLPSEARALIGVEGPTTTPVRKLLHRAGFRYLETVDPFDAGPHDGAPISEVTPIQRSQQLVRLDLPPMGTTNTMLLGNPNTHHFITSDCEIVHAGLRLSHYHANRFALGAGDPCWVMPLDW